MSVWICGETVCTIRNVSGVTSVTPRMSWIWMVETFDRSSVRVASTEVIWSALVDVGTLIFTCSVQRTSLNDSSYVTDLKSNAMEVNRIGERSDIVEDGFELRYK